jgi:hypothetical protein
MAFTQYAGAFEFKVTKSIGTTCFENFKRLLEYKIYHILNDNLHLNVYSTPELIRHRRPGYQPRSPEAALVAFRLFIWRHDIQHNDIQHNAIQHNNIQHNNK